MKHLVLYHANCMDGFAAACVAAKSIYEDAEPDPDTVEFRAVQYGSPAPLEDANGACVYVLDFAYSVEEMRQLVHVAHLLYWTDHHDDQLRRDVDQALRDEVTCSLTMYDTSLSGSTATWALLCPGDAPPEVLRYVQDRDLWTWALPNSREVSAALDLEFRGADVAADWGAFIDISVDYLKTVGEVLVRHQTARVKAAVRAAREWAYTTIGDGVVTEGTKVMIVNAPQDISEVGEALCEAGADLAVMYFQAKAGHWVYSLRSRPSDRCPEAFDCRQVASPNGGGGHRQAAGFQDNTFLFGEAVLVDELLMRLADLNSPLTIRHGEDGGYTAHVAGIGAHALGVHAQASTAGELVGNLIDAIDVHVDELYSAPPSDRRFAE
jgi:oligoribonuclease NrnB/cAMP/cGMP phosphodiesterase (DHH superfamily)